MRLRTEQSWRVPVLYGKFPKGPDRASTEAEKGEFAMFVFLLFRPHRPFADLLRPALGASSFGLERDVALERLYVEYQRWRGDEIDAVVAPYLDRCPGAPLDPPAFGSSEWWACMVALRLRNLDLALKRHESGAFDPPGDPTGLPATEGPLGKHREEEPRADAEAGDGSDAGSHLASEPGTPRADREVRDRRSPDADRPPAGAFPSKDNQACGTLPPGTRLESFHTVPPDAGPRSAEARYARTYQEALRHAYGEASVHDLTLAPEDDFDGEITAAAAVEAAERQAQFFKDVDAYKLEPTRPEQPAAVVGSKEKQERWHRQL